MRKKTRFKISEREIKKRLASESFAFVPDKLGDVMKAAGVEATLSPETEKIEKALQNEGHSFVPDSFLSIAKQTVGMPLKAREEKKLSKKIAKEQGSFVPDDFIEISKRVDAEMPLPQSEKRLSRRLIHEGKGLVPNVMPGVAAATKQNATSTHRRRMKGFYIGAFSCGAAALVIGLSVYYAIPKSSGSLVTGESAYLQLAITPASASSGGAASNSYSPTFQLATDADNIVTTDRFVASNYSASLVAAAASTSLKSESAPTFVSSLVSPAYQTGYLETKDSSLANTITISLLAGSDTYIEKYQTSYLEALDTSLRANLVYANVQIVDKRAEYKEAQEAFGGADDEKTKKAFAVYALFNNAGATGLTYSEDAITGYLKNEDESILNALETTLSNVNEAPLSDEANASLKRGIELAYARYKSGYSFSKAKTDDVDDLREILYRMFRYLPFKGENWDDWLDNDAFYLSCLDEESEATRALAFVNPFESHGYVDPSTAALNCFYRIRENVLSGLNKADFLDLLDEVNEQSTKSESPFPDEHDHDKGDHDHGEPGEGWGGGGIPGHKGDEDDDDWGEGEGW